MQYFDFEPSMWLILCAKDGWVTSLDKTEASSDDELDDDGETEIMFYMHTIVHMYIVHIYID